MLLDLKIETFSIIRKFRFSERGSAPITSGNRGSTVLIAASFVIIALSFVLICTH